MLRFRAPDASQHVTGRIEPPDLPILKKSYYAVLRSDGAVLPIEERLGRRLLRSLAPESREARLLLSRGLVTLTTADGKELVGMGIEDVYERLASETLERLKKHADDAEWVQTCRQALVSIHHWKRSLTQDH